MLQNVYTSFPNSFVYLEMPGDHLCINPILKKKIISSYQLWLRLAVKTAKFESYSIHGENNWRVK